MNNKHSGLGKKYSIKLKETVVPSSLDWLSGLTITPLEDGGSLVVGWFPDQSALRGLCEHLWNFNFTIQSVEQIEIEIPQPESGKTEEK